jgi:hypothetical protein
MKRARVMAITAVLTVILALCTWGIVGSAQPDSDTEDIKAVRQTTTFGTLGLVDGQTARLSAVREEGAARLCQVELNFFDLEGHRQGEGLTADLQPRQGVFLDLNSEDIDKEPNELRAQIYAVVDVISEAKKGEASCGVAMSIELFDQQDGRTQIYQGAFSAATKEERQCCRCCHEDPRTGKCGLTLCKPILCPTDKECRDATLPLE